jgi:acyl-CoA thioester hydrolase
MASDRLVTAQVGAPYAKQFLAGWGTMDFNGHLANRSYLDLAADVRMQFFAEHGFPPSEFRRLAIGPVVKKDELEYFREIGLHEKVTVTLAALGLSSDGARFIIENEVWTERGERWLDLRARKLVSPPPELLRAMELWPRCSNFSELQSLR